MKVGRQQARVIQVSALLLLATFTEACATRKPPAVSACPAVPGYPGQLSDASGPPTPVERLRLISRDMCPSEILGELGPAHRNAGSGFVILVWDADDGQTLAVGIAEPSHRPMYVTWNLNLARRK